MTLSLFSAEDCRAARALLQMTQADLAKASAVGISTIADFEKGMRAPIAANLTALQRAFEDAGVLFGPDGPTIYAEIALHLMTMTTMTELRFRYRFDQASVIHEIIATFGQADGGDIDLELAQIATPELKAAIDALVQRYGKTAPPLNRLKKIIGDLGDDEYFLLMPEAPASTADRLKFEVYLAQLNDPATAPAGNAYDELFGSLLEKYDLSLPRTDRQTIVGAKQESPTCRFCGRTATDGATFRKIAHIIPTALGNDHLKSAEECDTCNEYFGQETEPSLIAMLDVERVFLGTESRGGRPKLKYGKDVLHNDGNKVIVTSHSFNKDAGGTIQVNLGKGASLIPMAVYRALVKIVVSVVDHDQLPHLKKTIEWVRKAMHANQPLPMVASAVIDLPPNPSAQITVYKRRAPDARLPHLIGEFRLGCYMFVFAVPFSSEDGWDLVGFFDDPSFTAIFKHYTKVPRWQHRDLSGTNKVILSPQLKFVPR